MKKLTINWLDLEEAFEATSSDLYEPSEDSNYLDTETGQTVTLDETVSELVDEITAEIEEVVADGDDCTEEDVRNTETFKNLHELSIPSVLAALQFNVLGGAERYERIPQFDSHEQFEWMVEFVETVQDEDVRARLADALNHRRPFRNFRDAMGADRRLFRQWQEFQIARRRKAAIDWLESIGVQPLNPDEKTYNLPPLPDVRKIMFAEVRRYVRFARHLPNLQRIALLGALASDEEFPGSIELIVTISDDCDLAALATLSRQLAGHMLAHNAGASVFLASPTGEYLGRVCPWKSCGPGIRMSCDALSCGRRHYLHDDLKTVRLERELVEQPPVQLWPETKANSNCPSDVHEQLIQPLLMDTTR